MPKSSPYRVVFFDLDGTLSDFKAACDIILKNLYDEHQETFGARSYDDFNDVYWTYVKAREREERAGLIPMSILQNRELRFKEVLLQMGIDDTEASSASLSLAERYDYYRQRSAELFPDVRKTLEALQDRVMLCIITQGRKVSQTNQVLNLGIDGYFDHIITSEETGYVKPQLELYRWCFERAGVSPEEVIMVGDRVDWDLVPTRKLGCTTILYTENSLYYEDGFEDHEAVNHTVHNHPELLRLLESLLVQ